MRSLRVLLPCFAGLFVSVPLFGQAVISAHSGVVHFSEGAVFIDDKPLDHKVATFPNIKEGSTLRTEKGRAEVLLTPGVFLRVDENSAIRMRSNALDDTRVDFLQGCAIIDSLDALADNHVKVMYKDSEIRFPKPGVYRLDFETGTVLSYSGEAEVSHDGKKSDVDESHLFFLTLDLTTRKLDDPDDEFYDWARERSNTISEENQLVAESSGDPGDMDADPNALTVPLPNLGIPNAGVPSVVPPYAYPAPAPPDAFPMGSVLMNPFSPYAMGIPYNPFPVFPVFVFVRPRRDRSGAPGWPRSRTTGTSATNVGSWRTWNGVSRTPTLPRLSFPSPRPLPATMVRPSYAHPAYARPAYSRPVMTPRPAPAPAAVHAIGRR